MERPRKRPRLSMFADEPPNEELDSARHQNDRFLKGRFEAIFQKYERDFSGIGDEVDLATGEIIVNNGHLAGLDEDADTRSEADESVGELTPKSVRQAITPGKLRPITSGRAMLRAMTVAPDRDDAYFEDSAAEAVIESIETIAQTAAEKEIDDVDVDQDPASDGQGDARSSLNVQTEQDDALGSGSEAEDDSDENAGNELETSGGDDDDDDDVVTVQTPARTTTTDHDEADSDNDSLFDGRVERESSPDSLFEMPTAASSVTPHEEARPIVNFFDDLGDLDHDAIIARFGATVGEEVLKLIEQRDQAELHIEKAWRIPVQVEQAIESALSQQSVERTSAVPLSHSPSTPRQGASLWSLGLQPNRRLELHQERTLRVIRAESEDPLQEGFAEGGEVEVRIAEVSIDRGTRLLNRGTCPFCKEQFYSFESAKKHLLDILSASEGDEDQDETSLHKFERVRELLDNIEEHATDNEPEDDVDNHIQNNEQDHIVVDSVEEDDVQDDISHDPRPVPEKGHESEDDLFVDAGFVHSDDDDANEDELNVDTPMVIKMEQSPRTLRRRPSPEIPESDQEPEIRFSQSPSRPPMTHDSHSPLKQRTKPSTRARQRSFPPKETRSKDPPTRRPMAENLSESGFDPSPWPEFRYTADPYDRSADQNYRGRRTVTRSQLSLRPRTTKQRPSMILPSQVDEPVEETTQQGLGNGITQKAMRKPRNPYTRRTKPKVSFGPTVSVAESQVQTTLNKAAAASRAAQVAVEEASLILADSGLSDSEYHTPQEDIRSQPTAGIGQRASYNRDSNSIVDEEPVNQDADDEDEGASDNYDSEPVYHFNTEDFRSLVIMHEHEGQSLDSVGELMSNHYYNYRLEIDPLLDMPQSSDWTQEDEDLLYQLSMNPQTLMETIKRRLPHRSQFEIGNRLAKRWLTEIRATEQRPSQWHGRTSSGLKAKKTHVQILNLDEADAALENYDAFVPSRRKRKADPVKNRVCRQQSPGGTWRGCGRIFSQRSALHRHWKDSDRICFKADFDRNASPRPQKRKKATKDTGFQCRYTTPEGTAKGCGEWFMQRSTMYRHWRNSGRECRPPWHKQSTADTSDGEQGGLYGVRAEVGYDVGRAAAAAAALSSRSVFRVEV